MKFTDIPRDDHRVEAVPGHQRRGTRPARSGPSSGAIRALHASGPQGEFWFRLQRNPGGLYVEREERPCQGRPCVQSLHFRHADDFERWCDDDPVRFEHPLLHAHLKRDAAALWQSGAGSAGDG